MALITKPDMSIIWAEGGAIVEPSDVKKQTGWTAEVPPHQWENWIQNRQDEYLAHVNQRGIPAWDGLTNYEAGGLSYVQGSDGKVYKSVAASGPSSVAQNPTTDVSDTYWTVAFADVGAFLTQAGGDVRYAQRANNLSDMANLSTARTNLGVANAVAAGITGSHSNLRASATGTNATTMISADSVCVKDTSFNQVVLNSVSITPSLAASGANGLDVGVSAASTWYSVWVIWNGTTTAGLFSLSTTSPILPGGYTHKARVGWVRSDSNGANKYPLAFSQRGKSVEYIPTAGANLTAHPVLASGAVASSTAVGIANFVPITAGSLIFSIHAFAASQTGNYVAFGNISSSNFLDFPYFCGGVAGVYATCSGRISAQNTAYWITGANITGTIKCLGWEDNL